MPTALTKPATASWSADHLRALRMTREHLAPLVADDQVAPIDANFCVWDAWPILDRLGCLIVPDLWMALASPWFADSEERHGHARIHLFARTPGGWQSHGPVMPDGFSPGSREWSGSAVLGEDGETVTLYFTAAGRRGEAALSFEQRLFAAEATLQQGAHGWSLANWRGPTENIIRDPAVYMSPLAGAGAIGTIKAFRDPGYFLDPVSGQHYLFFTASAAGSSSAFNGVIGAAVATGPGPTQWQILPPVISADGLNNELERPHVIRHDGLYYMFWSTQSHVFDPAVPPAPTGLYGMASPSLAEGWVPLNGSGLVIANPPEAARQAYSWYVLPDLSVTSFVDDWGADGERGKDRRFGGCFAPFLQLALQGTTTRIIG